MRIVLFGSLKVAAWLHGLDCCHPRTQSTSPFGKLFPNWQGFSPTGRSRGARPARHLLWQSGAVPALYGKREAQVRVAHELEAAARIRTIWGLTNSVEMD